jgi:hypothetical protein
MNKEDVMGMMTAVSLKEDHGMNQYDSLRLHLCCNFYPPLPAEVVNETVEAFKDYHNGIIDEERLAERSYLRSVDALYKYHGPWMEVSDE